MKTKHLFILAFIIGITVTSCKKDDDSKTQDNIQGTWTYKRTEDAGNGTPSVINVSTGGENIVFKSDLTFVITSNYLMAQLANGLGSTPLNNGTYAVSNDGSTVTLSGKGQTSPSTPGGSQIIDNAWDNTLVISELSSNKLSFTQAYNYQWLTFYFEK